MSKPKLLLIPNDPVESYNHKGYSREERERYFNPNGEFEVSILGIKETRNDSFEFAGFPVYPSDLNLKDIEQIMRETKSDLVRGYNGDWCAELSGIIGKMYSIPSFISVHNLFPTSKIKEVDRIICVSNAAKKKCIEQGAKEEEIIVINDGINLDIFRDYRGTNSIEELQTRYNSKYRILSAGRLVWQKNLLNLMKASNIVYQELGKELLHLHIGDEGELKEDLENIVKKSNHIIVIPNVEQENLAHFYSWANLFTMASISEGFGLVYIEALACGTPIITSDMAPMNIYTINDYNGLLVNPNFPEDIAQKMIKALTDRKLYEILRSNSRESVNAFDIKELKKLEAKFLKESL
ncbi:glycosyltransferase family 4 protein [archaeon]|nr:glycosyltransferase family 4 protein [archaeon]